MDAPFYYLSAEDVVPRDAVHVIVGGSVTVVPPQTFRGHAKLRRVELQEGVEEIGAYAFYGCGNLARVDLPSSLRRIGGCAFFDCRFSEVILRDGLEEIGPEAFWGCDLRRIAVPSSVVEIGTEAFAGCYRLEAATLAGGMALVGRGAFFDCPQLNWIEIPSMAIVVNAGEDGSGQAVEVIGEVERDPSLLAEDEDEDEEPEQLILTSCYLALMSQEDRAKFTDAINQLIDDQTRGADLLDLGDVADPIRDCFANFLAEYKAGVAAVVELALWKANMTLRREASQGRAAGGGKRARVDAPTRDAYRRTCGADVVVGPVLSYLWGPHRRTGGEEENRGSIQL